MDALSKVPKSMQDLSQWIVWRYEQRGDDTTKVPYRVSGGYAKSNDSSTWCEFSTAAAAAPDYSGLGFMFLADDGFLGVDLDGCRDPETGEVAEWAREIINRLDSYSEVSPSGSGVKIFCRCSLGESPGRKCNVPAESRGGKIAGIEVYDRGRYFAVTGLRLKGVPHEPQPRQAHVDALLARYFPAPSAPTADWNSESSVLDRAAKYLATLPPAISGQRGHDKAFHAACVLVLGFGLHSDEAYPLYCEYNERCEPPWSEREIRHKLEDATRQQGRRNYLRDQPMQRWACVNVPEYKAPEPLPDTVTLHQSARDYIKSLKEGGSQLVSLGIGDVDYGIGGGVAFGEYIVMAARPSHGKTCLGLQAAYSAADEGLPVLILSEEMGRLALGKRAVQFASAVPEESWEYRDAQVIEDIESHFSGKSPIYIVENCGTIERAEEAVRDYVEQRAVRYVVVDYGQLLQGKGRNKYEQTSATSVALRRIANRYNIIVLVLCQMGREVESRSEHFNPKMRDIRDSGQIEQDADVVLFVCWPHRLASKNDPKNYLVFVAKNRNRPINDRLIKCEFNPSRQLVSLRKPEIDVDAAANFGNQPERGF